MNQRSGSAPSTGKALTGLGRHYLASLLLPAMIEPLRAAHPAAPKLDFHDGSFGEHW